MHYIEISTNDNEKYYVEGHSQEEIRKLFWRLIDEVNDKKLLAVESRASGSLFAIRTKDIKQTLVIGEDDLPLARKPNFILLVNK
ncbi:hypothetical protein I6N95_22745 [Vagococcus sp. BWB3-3]|uniref:Uncharacterized protein n=1 Tax=Vagococcus allomyrinae TaxID=2794353 RepID=A0A940P9L2_9ENTE|nr:hypothetical protein [Vagococcus allomyrinae]MBP1043852.1 hypothetical protein [Vagococcus allomyrinae]